MIQRLKTVGWNTSEGEVDFDILKGVLSSQSGCVEVKSGDDLAAKLGTLGVSSSDQVSSIASELSGYTQAPVH